MQEDKDITIYIGVTDNCDGVIVEEINKCCHQLTSKNSNGGQFLLAHESDSNYLLADYIINIEEGEIFLTRGDKAFNVKLHSNNSLSDVLHALTASWFLANLVGHDYADYVSCFKASKSSQLDIIEVNNADDLKSFLLVNKRGRSPSAITCYIEAVEKNMTYEWFEELAVALQPLAFDDETLCVMTLSAKPIQHSKSKVYLTWFDK
ncbi:hypothetical protein [Colwellia sp. Bg11-12]|uniref:hypothetical protein n=1 Tax=Colwellia sp. Bg11-12 TaxID=2759817 RepID=UPI0015F710E4|nr:hypothetical protein [Colwellia sp. Bg11-12]MBA6264273.1 hypothetical protein [Colwellia sp. Bg11-12]